MMSQDQPSTSPSDGPTIQELQAEIKRAACKLNDSEQPTVGPFPTNAFPELLKRVINETGKHSLYKSDYIGSTILFAISVAIGNCLATRYGTYEQKGSIYLAIVGLPGTNKSGPLEYAIKPLRNYDSATYQQYKQQKEEYDYWQGLNKKQREVENLLASLSPPTYHTSLVSDITIEFLVQTHQQNLIGLGLVADELAGWFRNFTRYNKGSEEQFWLAVWSYSPIKSGRKSAGIQYVDSPYLSVAGGIQPGVLSELAKDGRDQNGFIDRILFAFPDNQLKPKDSDTFADPYTYESYQHFMDKLLTLRNSIEHDDFGNIRPKQLPFLPDAYRAMRVWRDENTDRSNQTDSLAHKGIYAKLDAYCIRFTLLIEAMDWACNQSDLTCIRLTSVERAILLTEYFRKNAEKVHYILNEQTADERLPKTQQQLLKALPDEFTTIYAVALAKQLMPPVSERTVKRLLNNSNLFRRIKHGSYNKLS